MTNEQRNKMIDDRIEQHKIKMFAIELDLVSLRIVNDTEAIKALEEAIIALQQANESLERMKVV